MLILDREKERERERERKRARGGVATSEEQNLDLWLQAWSRGCFQLKVGSDVFAKSDKKQQSCAFMLCFSICKIERNVGELEFRGLK